MLLCRVSDDFVEIILVQTQCKSAARRPIGIALESQGEVDLEAKLATSIGYRTPSDLPTRFFRASVIKWLKALLAISALRPVNPVVGLTSQHMLQASHGEFRAQNPGSRRRRQKVQQVPSTQ
jgi:hypothetical protein